jgi:hypothetical protein
VAASSHVEPAAVHDPHKPAFHHRFGWKGGHVSIVGTLVLSLLIGTGLFSLQVISKWRRPKPAETDAKATDLDQPLTIAASQDDVQPSEEHADTAIASQSHSVQPAANSDDGAHHSLDGIFANANNNDGSENLSAGETNGHRAPYAPDPVSLSKATGSAVDDRSVSPPEAVADRNSLLDDEPTNHQTTQPTIQANLQPGSPPALQPASQAAPVQKAAVSAAPSPPSDLVDRPTAGSSAKTPAAGQSNAVYGLFEHAGASRKTVDRTSQETADIPPAAPQQNSANTKNVSLVDWNRPAPDTNQVPAPPAGLQSPDLGDAARRSLDAPGPVILPGRVAAANGPAAVSGAKLPVGGAAVGNATRRPSDLTQADASPQLRDLTQETPAIPNQPPAAIQKTSSASEPANPVYGIFDHRPGAAQPDAGHPEPGNMMAALDRTKVMSFQFRNAPWTVVLAEFATETHLELRMQSIPHGVFNRWDSARYSPSQTLAILNSELARTGCTLKLEGKVLKVCALSSTPSALSSSATTRPAAATGPSTWFPPQSSGLVPASGSY